MLKTSKFAKVVAIIYVVLASALFLAHLYSIKTNAGDSGESAIPLYLISLPWIKWVATAWYDTTAWYKLTYPVLALCVMLNALLICVTVNAGLFIVKWVRRLF